MRDNGSNQSSHANQLTPIAYLNLISVPVCIFDNVGRICGANEEFIRIITGKKQSFESAREEIGSHEVVSQIKEASTDDTVEQIDIDINHESYIARFTKDENYSSVVLNKKSHQRAMEVELGKKLEMEQVNASIAFRLSKTTDFKRALEETITEIGFLLGANQVELFCLDPNSGQLKLNLSWCALDNKHPIQAERILDMLDIQKVKSNKGSERAFDIEQCMKPVENQIGVKGEVIFIPIDATQEILIVAIGSECFVCDRERYRPTLEIIANIILNALRVHLAERKLRQSEERYRKVVEESLQGVIVFHADSAEIAYSNPTACKMLGYSLDELTSMTAKDVETMVHWTDRSEFRTLFTAIREGKNDKTKTDIRVTKKDGKIVWFELLLSRIEFENEPHILAALIDISEKRQSIADLQNSNRDLELYASLLRHDMKNDLQAIFSNTEAINLLIQDDELVEEFTSSTIAAVERMLDVLNIFGRPDDMQAKEIAPFLESIAVEAARSYVGMRCSLKIDPDVFMIRVIGGRLLPMVFTTYCEMQQNMLDPIQQLQ